MEFVVSEKLLVFLDIDGTLLYEPEGDEYPETLDGQLVGRGILPLLEFVNAHCQPYWLSYRARLGQRDILERRILPYLPAVADKIELAFWDEFKHEGLPLDTSFVWFDDDLEVEDAEWLIKHNVSDNHFRVDHRESRNPIIILKEIQRRLSL